MYITKKNGPLCGSKKIYLKHNRVRDSKKIKMTDALIFGISN